MTIQTEYGKNPRLSLEGSIANTSLSEVDTFATEGEVRFGVAVVRGTIADKQVRIPNGAVDKFLGVAARQDILENHAGVPTDRISFPDKYAIPVVLSGYIWVYSEQPVNAGDAVYYRHTAGAGGTILGRFRKDADTATANVIGGAVFDKTITEAGITVMRIPAHSV